MSDIFWKVTKKWYFWLGLYILLISILVLSYIIKNDPHYGCELESIENSGYICYNIAHDITDIIISFPIYLIYLLFGLNTIVLGYMLYILSAVYYILAIWAVMIISKSRVIWKDFILLLFGTLMVQFFIGLYLILGLLQN